MSTAPARKGYTGYPTGDVIPENEPGQPGHHATPETPNTCLCCGYVYYYLEPLCICAQNGNDWLQDELRRVTCQFHAVEKIKDGLFGALSGDFETPAGRPTYKSPHRASERPKGIIIK